MTAANVEAERMVIGAVLASPDRAFPDVRDLMAHDFTSPQNAIVWEAIRQMEINGEKIDPVIVASWLATSGHQDASRWTLDLVNDAPLPDAVNHYAKIVRDAAARQAMGLLAAEIGNRMRKGDDVDSLIAHAREELGAIETRSVEQGPEKMSSILAGAIETIERRAEHPERYGVHTGMAAFEEKIGALGAGNLITIGGTPGMGKTGLAIAWLHETAARGLPALMFSLEMPTQEIVERFLSRQARTDGRKIRQSQLDREQWAALHGAASWLDRAPIWIDSRPSRIHRLVAEIRRWHARHVATTETKIGLVAIDYVQLIQGFGDQERYEVITEATAALKLTARDLHIPIVMLSQLNRKGQEQKGPPTLRDLRGSGSIEADSDMVVFPWRDTKPGERNKAAMMDLIVAKNRHGPVGTVDAWWEPEQATFRSDDQQVPLVVGAAQ